jgi:hypothetical protein
MWTASLSGQVRQTHLPKWKPMLPLFEAIMNAFQAIQDGTPDDPRIIVNVQRDQALGVIEDPKVSGFTIIDNGIGFNDINLGSFSTAYSEYKLHRGGKGLGRLLWLKAFERAEIESVFWDAVDESMNLRTIDFNDCFSPDNVESGPTDRAIVGTALTLSGFREPWKSETPTEIDHIARRICEHFILLLMRPNCPRIELRDGRTTISINRVFEESFKAFSSEHAFSVRDQAFSIIGFRLNEPRSARHRIIYCADERAVTDEKLEKFIPNMAGRLHDEHVNSFVYLAVVTGEYLNDHVNPARTEFVEETADDGDEDSSDPSQGSLLPQELKRSEIRDECLKYIQEDLANILGDINATKLRRIETYVTQDAPHYRILLRRASEFIDRIPVDGSKNELEAALHKELHQREVELKREGGRIILEAAKLTEYDEYKDRLTDFMTNYNELGVAQLAQYVAHRRIILDLFKKAISVEAKDGRYPLERVLHHLIFPMQSDSEQVLLSQQNLWILDERLNYHTFVSSDKRLSQITAVGSSSPLRPDLLVFNQQFPLSEGGQPLTSLTIVEFKRPMRDDYSDDENPLKQVVKTVLEIRSGESLDSSGRKIKVAGPNIPTNCFIVCDITPKLREQLADWDATPTPDGQGYYGYHRTHKLYFEVTDYDQVLANAERRNQMLFERLKLL